MPSSADFDEFHVPAKDARGHEHSARHSNHSHHRACYMCGGHPQRLETRKRVRVRVRSEMSHFHGKGSAIAIIEGPRAQIGPLFPRPRDFA